MKRIRSALSLVMVVGLVFAFQAFFISQQPSTFVSADTSTPEGIIISTCLDGTPTADSNSDSCAASPLTPTPDADNWGTMSVSCGDQTAELTFTADADTDMNYQFSVNIATLGCDAPNGDSDDGYTYSQTASLPIATPSGEPTDVESIDTLVPVDTLSLPITRDFSVTCGGLTAVMHVEIQAPDEMSLSAAASLMATDCDIDKNFFYAQRQVELFGTPTS